jgi:hypothetical protein
VNLSTWIQTHRSELCSGAGSSEFRYRVTAAVDSLHVDQLITARDLVVALYRDSRPSVDRRRIRTALATLDDAIARAQLERDILNLTDREFALLTVLPTRAPFWPDDLSSTGVYGTRATTLNDLIGLQLVKVWPDGQCILSTRAGVLRKVAAMRVNRKTAAAERAIINSPQSRRYRRTLKRVLEGGGGSPTPIEVTPSVSLPLTGIQSIASVPTIIVALTSPSAFHWDRISPNSRWSRIQLHSDVDRFRAEAVDFLRSVYVTSSTAETLEVLAITLQDATTAVGRELSNIVEELRLPLPRRSSRGKSPTYP